MPTWVARGRAQFGGASASFTDEFTYLNFLIKHARARMLSSPHMPARRPHATIA